MEILAPSTLYILWILITLLLMVVAGVIVFLIIRKIFYSKKNNTEEEKHVILPVQGKYPQFGKGCFFAPNATIVGDVACGDECTFWFNSVVRGDVNFIKIGNKVNVQDGAVIHCTYQKNPTIIGNNVSIGHRAIVHGCTVHDDVLIGMGAIIMDRCIINSNSIIAAGAVVTEDTIVESNAIYAGIPAKKVKDLSQSYMKDAIPKIANNYVKYANWFKAEK